MYSYFYNWYYFSEGQINNAREQIIFFKERICSISDKTNMCRYEKEKKIKQIRMSIEALEYYYSL